jgi:Tripartite tricarboxylate transporter TctB family
MRYRSLKSTDFVGGVLTIGLSLGVLFVSQGYGFGSVLSMGPGFFPTLLGLLLLGLGTCLLVRGAAGQSESVNVPRIQPIIFIASAIALFSFTLLRLGLVPATIVLVVVSSMASRERKAKIVAISASCMAVFTYLIFIKGLAMNLYAFVW